MARLLQLSAIDDNVHTVCRSYDSEAKDVFVALTDNKINFEKEILSNLKRWKNLKWYLAVRVQFSKIIEGVEINKSPTFHGKTRVFGSTDDFDIQFNEAVDKIHESKSKFVQEGSAWTFRKVEQINLCMVRYKPLYGSSYIPTPRSLLLTKGVVNVKNNDEKCFLWSVLAALYPAPFKKERVNNYKKYESRLDIKNLTFPVSVDMVSVFEADNPTVSVNVFGYEGKDVYPLKITEYKERACHVNLLLLSNREGQNHYVLITNLSRLLSNLTAHKSRMLYCNYCLKRFSSETIMEKHTCVTPSVQFVNLSANSVEKCISSFISTPATLKHHSKGIINIYNPEDSKCFIWSILASLYPDSSKKHSVLYYKQFENKLDLCGIEFPVKPKNVDKFETLNPSISVNIFGYEQNEIYPIRVTKKTLGCTHVNLLLLNDEKGKIHYCLISELSNLLSDLTKHKSRAFYCNYCLHRFSSETCLTEHIPFCEPNGPQKTRLPEKESEKWMYFKNYTLTHKVPFTIYCDFESFLNPIECCAYQPTQSSTNNISKHIPSGFCYVIVDSQGSVIGQPVVYDGENVIETFLNRLLDEAKNLIPILTKNEPMDMTTDDKYNFESALSCHLCKKPLNGDKVANHDHISGLYLGAAHNSCNLNYKVPQHIPVFFHNFKGYDNHHIMEGLGKLKKEKISCIANSSESYLSVTLGFLRFLDSLQFMNASLDTLVENLAMDDPTKFKILRQCMGDKHINLLLRKGVFPYKYFTDETKFDEQSLPTKEHFFNDLTKTHISDNDYNHAQKVWSSFGMKTFREYHNLYLLTDVLLLADVFENFRDTSLRYYELDPCNFYSAPGLAWSSMLKMTDIKLELLTDIDQYNLIENSIRGGVSMIPNRYAKANNPLLPDYDSSKPTNFILYLDFTNLYGTSMGEYLPLGDFRWLNSEEINLLDITKVPDNSEEGFILEVDLEYPTHLHDLHSDFPLAPEKSVITQEKLSPYSKALQSKLDIQEGKVQKLLTTLHDKNKYTVHYKTLKLYIELGLVLKKIHRVLAFKQSAWLKPFIDFNTQKRKEAKNAFEKDFFKLINNSTYGRTLMNVRKHVDFHLVSNENSLLKLTANPRMTSFTTFNKDLAGVTLKKRSVFLNKPIYVGFSVLEISKRNMYNFYYNWAIKNYGNKVKLCMTDTDSLLMSIETQDIYSDMKKDLHLFDTSDYPTDHQCYSTVNKKKLGTFKDEMNSIPIAEFCGLRAKCYSILEGRMVEKKVAKGVPRVAIKTQLTHEDYKNCLLNEVQKLTNAMVIRSETHTLYTQDLCKLSLSPFDDKRYLLNSVQTLAYGHVKTRKRKLEEDSFTPRKKV